MNSIDKLYVTGMSSTLVFGADYDGISSPTGVPREVCFYREDWDVEQDTIVSVEYQKEREADEDLPPVLLGVEAIYLVRDYADADFLLEG